MRILEATTRERYAMGEEERILIDHCSSLSMRAHLTSGAAPFVVHSLSHPYPCSIFAFPGSWSADDWNSGGRPPFGETEVDQSLFPSLRSVGSGVIARVNEAFLSSFQRVLAYSSLRSEVLKAVSEEKRIIFTGHSSGGSIAVLATVWFLENRATSVLPKQTHPLCVTFGSPLIGDSIFNHAVERENWSCYFLHFIMPLDIVPRILLTPLSSYKEEIQAILNLLSPRAQDFSLDSVNRSNLVSCFYGNLLRNALSVSCYQACTFMGCTNSILETLTSFMEISPYKPFGTCVFCTNEGRAISISNPDSVLQLLFYLIQLSPQQQLSDMAYRSLNEHWQYEVKLKQWTVQNGEIVSLSFSGLDGELDGMVFNDLELGKEARLRIRAAYQWEKQRLSSQARIDTSNCTKIREALKSINDYKSTCELRGISYYDSFKLQRNVEDFNANVKRLELVGLWDEIVEMLRRRELPDCFEGRTEWVDLGTVYRRLVEPLDIANYYRHSKNEDTGSYLLKGRPRRYRYTQRWHEQAQRLTVGSSPESCFWAVVEELKSEIDNKSFNEMRERIVKLENELLKWFDSGNIGRDVFLGNSSFVVWWKSLPDQHRSGSCIAKLVYGEGNSLI